MMAPGSDNKDEQQKLYFIRPYEQFKNKKQQIIENHQYEVCTSAVSTNVNYLAKTQLPKSCL